MLEHKPGKGTRAHDDDHGHAHHQAGGTQPGKQSRVEQELGGGGGAGPLAVAADAPDTSITTSEFVAFHSGDVYISESVAATLHHGGSGPISMNLNKGGMSFGHHNLNVDFKSADAVTGKHLRVSGASVDVIKNHAFHSGPKIEDGYVGVNWTTEWTIKGKGHHPWSTTISMSTFIGTRPPHQKHHKHWWQHLPVVSTVVAAAAAAIAAVAGAIIASSPEWGPVVVVALA